MRGESCWTFSNTKRETELTKPRQCGKIVQLESSKDRTLHVMAHSTDVFGDSTSTLSLSSSNTGNVRIPARKLTKQEARPTMHQPSQERRAL